MRHNDDLHDKLITYLQDACAMEHHIAQVLEGQVQDTEDYPQIQSRIQQHLDETRMHEQRMEQRLAAYDEKRSSVKTLGTSLLGSLTAMAGGGRTDALSKAARDDYATEHLEIAAYELLIATAQLCGDHETILAAKANMRDEARMAMWLEEHLPETVVYSFQKDGVALDESQIPVVRQAALDSLRQSQSGMSAAGDMTEMGDMGDMTDAGQGMTPPNAL